MSDINTQWSSKFKKFGITDPFLKLITVKYENSIPWQTLVKDELTLNQHIKDVLLPDLKKKTIWNGAYHVGAKSLFVRCSDLDIEQILETDELTANEKSIINLHLDLGDEYDDEESEFYMSPEEIEKFYSDHVAPILQDILNKKKEAAFEVWFENIQKEYPKNVAFHYLILEPIIEQSGYNTRQLLPAPDNVVLKWLFFRMKRDFYEPSTNFGLEYTLCLSND
jgi:hypothetical protein